MKAQSLALATIGVLCLATSVDAQHPVQDDAMQDCPMHGQQVVASSHERTIAQHGDEAMGFLHDKTTHHFLLFSNGGVIQATANDPSDKASTEATRAHLQHIALAFADGDFSIPMFVHDGVPPGVTTMKLLKAKIRYEYEKIPSGGRVLLKSSDDVALAAIHDFLRFQISEHQTGDTLTVEGAH